MKYLALLLCLCACACRPSLALPFELRPPGTGPAFFATQAVTFHLPMGRTEEVLTTVENGPDSMAVVATTPMGLTLFVLNLKDGVVALDARVPLPKEFDPKLLPTLIQLSEWPLVEASKGLGPGLALTETGNVRTLTRKGKPFLTLTRTGGGPPFRNVVLDCPSMGLQVDIKTLED
jgi:hypothetical protein